MAFLLNEYPAACCGVRSLIYTLVQMVENQFLVPKITGGAVDLPPLVVLIGVIVLPGLSAYWELSRLHR